MLFLNPVFAPFWSRTVMPAIRKRRWAAFASIRAMACCAADARPVAVLVECNKLPKVPEMKWVRITGTATFLLEAGKLVPVLRAQKVEPCAPPDERFIF